MYSTKTFNPKKVETGYLSHGDPYDKVDKHRIDMEELKNPGNWKRHTGMQFHHTVPKKGQTAGYFATFTYAPDSYQEHVPYLEREPPAERPSGFGTRDARRRDEFTNHIKAQQYKEIISREYKKKADNKNIGGSNDVYLTTAQQVAAHAREKIAAAQAVQSGGAAAAAGAAAGAGAGAQTARVGGAAGAGKGAGAPPASAPGGARPSSAWYEPDYKAARDNKTANNVFQSNPALPPIGGAAGAAAAAAAAGANPHFQNTITKYTYDIGKAKNATTPICYKCSRETFYCKHRVGSHGAQTARYVGHYKTTQMNIGHGHDTANALKPAHGRKGTLNAFRDYTHLSTTFS